MKKELWNVDEIRNLIENEQKTLKKVALSYGCCTATMQVYCKEKNIKPKMGVPAKVYPVEQIRDWIENQGKTHKWIAEQIGCSNQHISRICKKNKIKTHRSGPRRGEGHPGWKGGRHQRKGYWYVYNADHPNCTKNRYVAEHRLVMEKKIGRYLTRKEVVHHLDGNRVNNHPDNLHIYPSNGVHLCEGFHGRLPNYSLEDCQKMLEAAQRRANHAKLKRGDDQQGQESHR